MPDHANADCDSHSQSSRPQSGVRPTRLSVDGKRGYSTRAHENPAVETSEYESVLRPMPHGGASLVRVGEGYPAHQNHCNPNLESRRWLSMPHSAPPGGPYVDSAAPTCSMHGIGPFLADSSARLLVSLLTPL